MMYLIKTVRNIKYIVFTCKVMRSKQKGNIEHGNTETKYWGREQMLSGENC